MKSFADVMREDQRRAIVRLLAEQNGFTLNCRRIADGLSLMGDVMSMDQVKTHLHWLAEQELVALSEPVPGVLVAKLSERGHEVAIGRARVPGVSTPGA